jgi:hypothetical protein
MKQNRSLRVSLARIALFASFATALLIVHGVRAGNEPFHLATDWSHRHMIFSAPKTLMDRFRFSTEPRYVQQWVRRNSEVREDDREERERWHHAEENPIHGDWSVFLGNVGATVGTVGADQYPGKYSFDTTVASCASATQPDFVVWNTSLAGSSGAIAAIDIGTFAAGATANASTITITNGANTLTMTAAGANGHTGGAGTGAGTFNRAGNATARATNLAAAINLANNGSFVGISATSSGNTVTVIAATTGVGGNSITVAAQAASSLTWASANFEDGQASGVPSIVAYDNLYSNCTGTVPSTYWAYNTGGTVTTSVALSFDGKQVAFVQTVAGVANLVVLKWAANSGTPTAPVTLSSQGSASAYRSCTAPCMYAIAFSGGANDTNSSPYSDFANDAIYVGDTPTTPGATSASLHKFTGVFGGTPAEMTTGGWPAVLGVEAATSPVYDPNNGQVYVADANNGTDGGFVYRVDHTAGAVIKSSELSLGSGFVEGPILDSTNGTVYLFTSAGGACPGTNNFVYQLAGNFASSATFVTSATVSGGTTCSATRPLYAGDFDNAYYSGGAGHMYVCGNIGGNPTLFQVNVSAAGALGTVSTGPNVATATTTCSPVTEFYNSHAAGGAKDWIYLSVIASGRTAAQIGCPTPAGGCLMSFDVTSGAAISGATATAARARVSGGASGVVADNDLSTAGDSELYFTPLAAEGCATAANPGIGGCSKQATQSALN